MAGEGRRSPTLRLKSRQRGEPGEGEGPNVLAAEKGPILFGAERHPGSPAVTADLRWAIPGGRDGDIPSELAGAIEFHGSAGEPNAEDLAARLHLQAMVSSWIEGGGRGRERDYVVGIEPLHRNPATGVQQHPISGG